MLPTNTSGKKNENDGLTSRVFINKTYYPHQVKEVLTKIENIKYH
jgi:hypothetical protein